MAWLKNLKTHRPIPASQLKWIDDDTDTRSVADVINASTIDRMYPVGSIYMSVNNTNPSTLFGGTWVQLKDRFLLGAGDNYTAGTTGGEASHALTESEMPAHNHWVWKNGVAGIGKGTYGFEAYLAQSIVSNDGVHGVTSTTGSGTAHNNMPPYLVVYMWKRTA